MKKLLRIAVAFFACLFMFCGCSNGTEKKEVSNEYFHVYKGCLNRLTLKGKELTEIVIPSEIDGMKITSLGDIFTNRTDITSVTLPEGIKTIFEDTFKGCTGLTHLNLPNSLATVWGDPFSSCTSLPYNELDGAKYLGNENNPYVYLASAPTDKAIFEVPYGCSILAEKVFRDNKVLTEIRLPQTLLWIGKTAFYGCSQLKTITIPDKVTAVEDCTFAYCTSLETVMLGDSVDYIYSKAFYECSSLRSISLGSKLDEIGSDVFYGCTALQSIRIPKKVTFIAINAFRGTSNLTVYCEARKKPADWEKGWDNSVAKVLWNQ